MININYEELYGELLDQIGVAAWGEAKVNVGKDGDGNDIFHYRVDVLWYFIAQLKLPESSNYRFKYLPLIAEIVLVIPHSNAGQERLFSIVRKNKNNT